MPDTVITVAGSHRVVHDPERARVRVGIGFEGSKRDSVLAATRAALDSLAGSLATILDEEVGPVVAWHSETIRVWGERHAAPDGTRLPVEFHSAVFLDAEFSHFEALSEWIDVAAARDGIAIDGIEWMLAPATEAALAAEARRGAVADALEKADDYASALGLGELVPLAIADPGLLDGGVPVVPYAPTARAVGGGMELRPAAITVETTVHVRFTAAPDVTDTR
ncbi:hypothetical protein GCM10010988_07420 [Cnuibacter physcomitrellae]|uniref:Uncharacterized protein n=1 Tax=Cnuibacter physcomitrellae TaxID=1619308 RepID=A0A1X9LNT7_9MICO|nr:SIMPL domain-containing protein [Cnuibacter physcomitrellae]ARJ05631.1 hypothetical protein B5808_10660 [Cnuibacter physcomitrellae]GGI36132.1 hypothetical protein GCM10010988_07420 [Cnuibacter physcomitrellae]